MTPARAPSTPPSRSQGVVKLFILAGGLAFIGLFPFLGIPGALWMTPGQELLPALTGLRLPGDAAWPMAIMITLIWPWFLPAIYWLAWPRTAPGWNRGVVVCALTASASVLLALAIQYMALK